MSYQELIDYIKKARASGGSDEQIRTALLAKGWREGDANEGFGLLFTSIDKNVSSRKVSSKTIIIAVGLGFLIFFAIVIAGIVFGFKNAREKAQEMREISNENAAVQNPEDAKPEENSVQTEKIAENKMKEEIKMPIAITPVETLGWQGVTDDQSEIYAIAVGVELSGNTEDLAACDKTGGVILSGNAGDPVCSKEIRNNPAWPDSGKDQCENKLKFVVYDENAGDAKYSFAYYCKIKKTGRSFFTACLTKNDHRECVYSHAAMKDDDMDNLPNDLENLYDTNNQKQDTDGDSHLDGDELINGFNPLIKEQ